MKHLHTVITVLLNVLFCTAFFWFFNRHSFLRPYAGSFFKEFISGLFLLGSLYINYYLLYPKIYPNYSHLFYWLTVVQIAVMTGVTDLSLAYANIMSCNSALLELVGYNDYFLTLLLLITGRNLAFNFFPYLIRVNKSLQEHLDSEVRIVYQGAKMIDVIDRHHNMQLIRKDEIYYCRQEGNYTRIYVTQCACSYIRYGSMKYLEQLFGEEEFIRISASLLLPYRYISSCQETVVTMKMIPCEKFPPKFRIGERNIEDISRRICQKFSVSEESNEGKDVNIQTSVKSFSEKAEVVLKYIKTHPGIKSTDIVKGTTYSLSTVERCIAELRKQDAIQYQGSKKTGGYYSAFQDKK